MLGGLGYVLTRDEEDHDHTGIGGDEDTTMNAPYSRKHGTKEQTLLNKIKLRKLKPDSELTLNGVTNKIYKILDDSKGSQVITELVETIGKDGKSTFKFEYQEYFTMADGVFAPVKPGKDGKIHINSPFGPRDITPVHFGNDMLGGDEFYSPVDLENITVTKGQSRTTKITTDKKDADGNFITVDKDVGIWKKIEKVEAKDEAGKVIVENGKPKMIDKEVLYTFIKDKNNKDVARPYTKEMADADYANNSGKNKTYQELLDTPMSELSGNGNSVSGQYKVGNQVYTLRFKHLKDLSSVIDPETGNYKTTIKGGAALGQISSTGYSTGNHAHFGVESGSNKPSHEYFLNMSNPGKTPIYAIDPIYFLNQIAASNERSKRNLLKKPS